MRKEYNLSQGKRVPNAKQLKQSVTMRVDRTTLEYSKGRRVSWICLFARMLA